MTHATCGYTVYDSDGEEQPCDEPATGWRWYQGHAHEDMLDVACMLHQNEGGRRLHAAEAKVARVEVRLDEWSDWPITAQGQAADLLRDLRAALASDARPEASEGLGG